MMATAWRASGRDEHTRRCSDAATLIIKHMNKLHLLAEHRGGLLRLRFTHGVVVVVARSVWQTAGSPSALRLWGTAAAGCLGAWHRRQRACSCDP
jgi:hypothetical protein